MGDVAHGTRGGADTASAEASEEGGTGVGSRSGGHWEDEAGWVWTRGNCDEGEGLGDESGES